jgi:ferric-dicitrate binding protein FerR (iron transport regulator)
MPDNRILHLLARKVAGEATADELSELQNLLERYPDGVYMEEVLTQLWAKQPVDNAGQDLEYIKHKLKYAADFEPVEDDYQPNLSKIKSYLAIAVICLLTGAGVLYYHRFVKNTPVMATEISAGKGVRKKIILPDGTQVWLNSNSRLTFNNDLNAARNRVVMLTGEAYFDVVKNKHRPFIIQTDKVSIKVLGTAFNVKAYPTDSITETSLIRGTIELTVFDNQKQKIVLKPGEKLLLADNNTGDKYPMPARIPEKRKLSIENIKPVEIESQEYIEETSWINDKLIFKNESFGELAPRLERWYNVKIHVNNRMINDYHFTGIFKDETIEQALKAMQLIRPFKFKINNDEIDIN